MSTPLVEVLSHHVPAVVSDLRWGVSWRVSPEQNRTDLSVRSGQRSSYMLSSSPCVFVQLAGSRIASNFVIGLPEGSPTSTRLNAHVK